MVTAKEKEMRLRILLTNGMRAVDLYWLTHNGTDLYYGGVGFPGKHSYHASGAHHSTLDGQREIFPPSQKLNDFKGFRELQAMTFFPAGLTAMDTETSEFHGKKANSILHIDTRTTPEQITVALYILEPSIESMTSFQERLLGYGGLLQVHMITTTIPWIVLVVVDVEKHFEKMAQGQ